MQQGACRSLFEKYNKKTLAVLSFKMKQREEKYSTAECGGTMQNYFMVLRYTKCGSNYHKGQGPCRP